MLYEKLIKPSLFRLDAERAHHLTIHGLGRASRLPVALKLMEQLYGAPRRDEMAVRIDGVNFPNPVGLAAGLDKNAEAVPAFSSLGFGFVEVGTVTPQPQPGNEQPRLFRLPEDQALINRMGFNNLGAKAMAERLRAYPVHKVPVAVNIGKNKWTPNESAEEDYRQCLRELYPYGDFFVVNISSPNTPDLRKLQHGGELSRVLGAVMAERREQCRISGERPKPVFVKIAPDLEEDQIEYMMESIAASGATGVIAANTTLRREGLRHPARNESGGLSGRPLTRRATEIIRKIYRATGGKLPIVGVGGIFSARDAYDKIKAGASLVQVYTGMIYRGPELIRAINDEMAEMLRLDGFRHISEAVGAGD